MRKFLKKLGSVLTVIIFVVCLAVFVSVVFYASTQSGVPLVGNYGFVNVRTESMVPTYNVGDVVIIKKVSCEDITSGDVISFYSEDPSIQGMPNTHRVVSKDNINGVIKFTTKGDNNPAEDIYKVEYSSVIGKAVKSIPSVGKVINYLQNNGAVFFLIIILPLIVLTFFEIRNVYLKAKEVKSEDEKKND